jgi:hypothetical protein
MRCTKPRDNLPSAVLTAGGPVMGIGEDIVGSIEGLEAVKVFWWLTIDI